MSKKISIAIISLIATLLSVVTAQADYSNTVMSLSPVAYWPLNETVQPPAPYLATNSGTLGTQGNGYYSTYFENPAPGTFFTLSLWSTNVPGATADGDTAVNFTGDPYTYIQIPHTFAGSVIKAPFSVECWVNPNAGSIASSLESVVSAGGLEEPLNNSGNLAGFDLGLTNGQWFFTTFNTNGSNPSAQVLANATGAGDWDYLVATFDGTNINLYVNGNLISSGVASNNAAGLGYVPDNVNPIQVGMLNPENSDTAFQGSVDELAIYTNVLSQSAITSHFQAASNGGYASSVTSAKPPIYLRLNDPSYSAPTNFTVFPTAYSYGSIGSAANGSYQPGTLPGVAGPTGTGFGSANYAVAFNGLDAGVDVGAGNLPANAPGLNVTGNTPLSVVVWFKGNPADSYNRFQTLLGQGDSGWRMGIGGVGPQFNPGGGGELGSSDIYNDGNWHMAVGVYDGIENYIYIDGKLVFSVPYSGSQSGSSDDVLIGGAPDYTFAPGGQANRYWSGSLAQVAFFTTAISASDITQLYNAAGMAPQITQQPLSATLNAGFSYVNASRSVISGSSLSYQWYQDGSPASGQTNANLMFSPMLVANVGNYFVIATNTSGAVTSSIITLTINTNLSITTQTSTNFELFAGISPKLSVTASGSLPIYYFWNSNGVTVAASTNSSYVATNVIGSVNYFCLVSNSYASVTSSIISVGVVPLPTNAYPLAVLADSPIAYWRLGEADQGYPNNGVIAYDNVGGHNGVYSQTVLGQVGYPSAATDFNTAAAFGDPAANNSDMQVATGVNFGTNGNAEFSIEAWVFVTPDDVQYLQGDGSGIITVGQGDGGEQFNLDTGSSDSSGNPAFRFFVRDANGDLAGNGWYALANSSVTVGDGKWHHLVGVCDEANGKLFLYIDGVNAASASMVPGSGAQSSSNPLSIGSRQSGNGIYDDQFPGSIDEVAIYSYPLDLSQVQAHYNSALTLPAGPEIAVQPVSGTAILGTLIPLSVTVTGTPPFQYQWYQDGVPVGTNSSVYDATIIAGTNNYYCVVTSALGAITTITNVIQSIVLTDSGTNSATNITTFAANFMDAANAAYTPDSGTSWFNVVYQGLGVYSDLTENTNWNGFGFYDGYQPSFTSTPAPQLASDGTLLTPISLNLAYNYDYEAGSGLYYGPNNYGGNTSQTEPSLVLGVAAAVNGNYPGIGTSNAPLGGITLSNVPPGTYTLYLYGAAPNNNYGATFNFTSGGPLGGTNTTINSNIGVPASNFVYSVTYVIYTNVVPNSSGVISGTWGAVSNSISGNSGEGDFNGLQLVRVSGAASAALPVLSIKVSGNSTVISWSPTNGVLQSATSLTGTFTDISGSTSPYTNSASGTQQFFRVKVQ